MDPGIVTEVLTSREHLVDLALQVNGGRIVLSADETISERGAKLRVLILIFAFALKGHLTSPHTITLRQIRLSGHSREGLLLVTL